MLFSPRDVDVYLMYGNMSEINSIRNFEAYRRYEELKKKEEPVWYGADILEMVVFEPITLNDGRIVWISNQ